MGSTHDVYYRVSNKQLQFIIILKLQPLSLRRNHRLVELLCNAMHVSLQCYFVL